MPQRVETLDRKKRTSFLRLLYLGNDVWHPFFDPGFKYISVLFGDHSSPLVSEEFANLNMTIEIGSCPIENGDCPSFLVCLPEGTPYLLLISRARLIRLDGRSLLLKCSTVDELG